MIHVVVLLCIFMMQIIIFYRLQYFFSTGLKETILTPWLPVRLE